MLSTRKTPFRAMPHNWIRFLQMQGEKRRKKGPPACSPSDQEHRTATTRQPRTPGRPETGPVIPPPGRAPPRARDRSGAFLPWAAPSSPPLDSLLPEGGRGRPATPKPQLPGRAGPRRPERPARPAPSPLAPARPLYHPKPLPRQRGLRGPLLLILSRRYRPSAAETGTSSAPGRCLHKGAAAFSARPAGRWSTQRRVAPTPLPAYPARGPGAGRGCVLACGGGA